MKSILVIDDNSDIRENIVEILELSGYKVFSAANGKEGIETAIKFRPDLIICDIMMPELDGYGVLEMIRNDEHMANTPFIFLTAKAEKSDFQQGIDLGASNYIKKPFDDHELIDAVKAQIGR